MPVKELVHRLSDLNLSEYRVNASMPGRTLETLSMTSGVSVIDQSMAAPGRSCGSCWLCGCCDPASDDDAVRYVHED